MAEYISDRAAARIDGRTILVAEPAGDRPPFPLLDWMLSIDFNTAGEEQVTNEYEGYLWSKRFFDQLEATIGPDALRRAMTAVVPLQAGTVGVRRFMDAVDDPGGIRRTTCSSATSSRPNASLRSATAAPPATARRPLAPELRPKRLSSRRTSSPPSASSSSTGSSPPL